MSDQERSQWLDDGLHLTKPVSNHLVQVACVPSEVAVHAYVELVALVDVFRAQGAVCLMCGVGGCGYQQQCTRSSGAG